MGRRLAERWSDQEDVTWRHEDGSGGKEDRLPRQPEDVKQGHPGPRHIRQTRMSEKFTQPRLKMGCVFKTNMSLTSHFDTTD